MLKCPLCEHETKVSLIDNEKVTRCPACGAYKDINQTSGNTIWIKNNRVVFAEEDIKEQQKEAENRGFKKENLKGNELTQG